jgi:hypothetical protein
VAYGLRDEPTVSAGDRQSIQDGLAWFEKHLATPDRFNRSGSKGYYRRTTRGIAWFRDSATECIAQMHELKRVLEANGYSVALVREDRVGYIVYEDDLQVVAEPFSDTRTGG